MIIIITRLVRPETTDQMSDLIVKKNLYADSNERFIYYVAG